jgi:hypothetical protein
MHPAATNRAMIKILHHPPKRYPDGQRIVYNGGFGIYYGWTGYEPFGVIWAYRYYGWQVTCWAQVHFQTPPLYFGQFKNAVTKLDQLMDKAEQMGVLAHERVPLWPPGKCGPPPMRWWQGFEFIRQDIPFNPDCRQPFAPAFTFRRVAGRYKGISETYLDALRAQKAPQLL